MIKIGIIGCGKIAQVRHIPEYLDNENAELAGYFDLNYERAAALADEFGGKAYDSYEALLAEPANRRGQRMYRQPYPRGNNYSRAACRQACVVRETHGHYPGRL